MLLSFSYIVKILVCTKSNLFKIGSSHTRLQKERLERERKKKYQREEGKKEIEKEREVDKRRKQK